MNCENRLSRLAGHILEQQSFYPMFPSPDKLHPQVFPIALHALNVCVLICPFSLYSSTSDSPSIGV